VGLGLGASGQLLAAAHVLDLGCGDGGAVGRRSVVDLVMNEVVRAAPPTAGDDQTTVRSRPPAVRTTSIMRRELGRVGAVGVRRGMGVVMVGGAGRDAETQASSGGCAGPRRRTANEATTADTASARAARDGRTRSSRRCRFSEEGAAQICLVTSVRSPNGRKGCRDVQARCQHSCGWQYGLDWGRVYVRRSTTNSRVTPVGRSAACG
jgi:hypothetical protein